MVDPTLTSELGLGIVGKSGIRTSPPLGDGDADLLFVSLGTAG